MSKPNIKTDQIRAARAASGLTQEEAAALVHCVKSAWSKWEQGVNDIHPAFFELFLVKTADLRRARKALSGGTEAA